VETTKTTEPFKGNINTKSGISKINNQELKSTFGGSDSSGNNGSNTVIIFVVSLIILFAIIFGLNYFKVIN
jgi:hypothetical protein